MNYHREIGGLRALAMLPVVLFHAGLDAFSGRTVGVDVFFVISGCLIAPILIEDLERGRSHPNKDCIPDFSRMLSEGLTFGEQQYLVVHFEKLHF